MKQRILAAFLAMCIICCLTACGGSGTASNAGTSAGGETGGETGGGTGQAQDTGLFPVEGGWKDPAGNVILFDSGGKGCVLAKVIVPETNGGSDTSGLQLPDMVKTSITWEEGAESATVKILENEYEYKKTKEGGKEQLTVQGVFFDRLSESELKEYEEKAASLQDFGGAMAASSGQQAGSTSGAGSSDGHKTENFSDVILFENDIAAIELVKFYEDEVNWGDINKTQLEKYITIKVKNKSDKEFDFRLDDGYIHDESVNMACYDDSQGPAPGKSKTYTYNIYYNLNPDHVPLDSFEDLYTLDAAVDIRVKGDGYSKDSKPRIVLSEILGGAQTDSLAAGSGSDSSPGSSGAVSSTAGHML